MFQKTEVQIKIVLVFLLAVFFYTEVYGAACTSISRTNNSSNSVLTSTKYNNDHNTSYTAINDIIDANCTIGKASLTASDFAAPWDSFKDGCEVTWSDNATLLIGPCRLAVDGEWVNTTTSTSVTWGCTDCASEVNTSVFYLYAKDGSTGTTLTPLISSTAPTDNHGEDGSNNKALAKFYNNGSGNIENTSIMQWNENGFRSKRSAGFWASLTWQATTNCQWTFNPSTSFGDFPADTDCDDKPRLGEGIYLESVLSAGNSDGQTPIMEVSYMPAGHYVMIISGELQGGNNDDVAFRIYDGSNAWSSTGFNVGQAASNQRDSITTAVSSYTYETDQTNLDLKVQCVMLNGTQCIINNQRTTQGTTFKMELWYFPKVY